MIDVPRILNNRLAKPLIIWSLENTVVLFLILFHLRRVLEVHPIREHVNQLHPSLARLIQLLLEEEGEDLRSKALLQDVLHVLRAVVRNHVLLAPVQSRVEAKVHGRLDNDEAENLRMIAINVMQAVPEVRTVSRLRVQSQRRDSYESGTLFVTARPAFIAGATLA